ncbi:MAG: xanthine dehydrogenase family protein molybdopterin-binding subunit [Deltaproteobacteria bacterium]|nr:xanthine dehydrogenase family protein molybdopterin-binding subunit [Deltaproteobacteria bacterium]MBW2694955.1 xanthine dehydrogenase family protein molybdopterin-binding subunit [Deltaproteobacteria bacterium]
MSEEAKFRWIGTRVVRPDGVDKVTGRATYGADFALPDMLWGRVLRSPHAHARILSVDTSRALAHDGVEAVITSQDLPDIPSEEAFVGEQPTNFRELSHNVMARGKVLYHGHALAAVAATTPEIAASALDLIEVDYEVLPHVLDMPAAMAASAPSLHRDLEPAGFAAGATVPPNVSRRIELGHGEPDQGFAAADVVVEREFTTKPVHQGYIEPHACLVQANPDDDITIWSSSQGHFMVRAYTAKLLGIELSKVRAIPAEIGGGFGGKTTVYLEPLAAQLSRISGRPVKMVMSREEVFRATGPALGTRIRVKMGCKQDGRLTGAEAVLHYEAGAFPGSPVQAGAMTMFAPYELEHVRVTGYDVLVNKPKTAAYRAPGAPMGAFAVETVIDELAEKLEIDPIELRLRNAARKGTQAPFGPRYREIGCVETLEALRSHPHYTAPLGPNQGRGVALGFWFNAGMQSSAGLNVNEDGSVSVISGNPDIGGSRASLALMAAEEMGIDYEKVGAWIADTASIGFSDITGGSRVTFATGMAVVEAARDVKRQLCERAAAIWEVEPERVKWVEGEARLEGEPDREPLGLVDLAQRAARTGGPISGRASLTARGVGMAFGAHICDVEVDPETGRVEVIRYTAVQDAGRAIHPSYVEGQMQGGAAQGIGWALNEEYVYDEDGKMCNPSFLDYRMPVASDLPMIDTVIVEVPNPRHPYGVRGVGEVPIVPPIPAVVNAVHAATGVRYFDLPLSPPRVLAGIEAAADRGA